MKTAGASGAELRVLVVAPVGRDAELTCELLRGLGIACEACAGVGALGRELAAGAGALVLTSEALAEGGAAELARLLDAQETWSDIPIVIATAQRDERAWETPLPLGRAGKVTILERPIRLVTLRTVVESALRARKRQYQVRDLLEQLRVSVERLDTERVVRERFVSLLAHDLRGPLSTAVTAARMLLAMPESLEQRRDLALRIERNMLRIDRMVHDLLDANRIRAGHRLPLDLQPCDLVEIVADVVADLPERDRARVRTSLPDRLEGTWDPHQLHRALWNLVSNALKYGAADAPVELRGDRSPTEVAVSVHNGGPAIPVEDQARIFEPFGRVRGDEARARGWGLGLTLVRGCAEAHGGAVELTSTPAGGTTFTLRLPFDARTFLVPPHEP